MKMLVDEIPEYPQDCLFSILNKHNGETYYTCMLKENIEGKHKNSPAYVRTQNIVIV